MKSKTVTWLKLRQKGQDLCLQRTVGLEEILGIEDPTPSLVLLIGESSKARSLRSLIGCMPNCVDKAFIRLHKPVLQSCSDRSLLFADGPSFLNGRFPSEGPMSGDLLPRYGGLLGSATPYIYSGIFGPLADVVCMFLEDSGGLAGLIGFVTAWLEHAPQLEDPALPTLAIITEESVPAMSIMNSFFNDLRQSSSVPFERGFSGLAIHSLSSASQLQGFLKRQSTAALANRRTRGLAFSSRHFYSFLDGAYDALINTKPFNYVALSRVANPIPPDATLHLCRFVRDFVDSENLTNFVLPIAASSIMVDAFAPGMHGT